ncbi:liver-expressed antimicrobial peptide 2-like [Conger conger]|uniref:liver-expressed antimicrobial peptide 2-like n=1 Tax=Conger conger TaxID=82655 RepID=UPI002A5AEC21|nr:liver-expressed antimicrobial peptide 2-like [Conger conger]
MRTLHHKLFATFFLLTLVCALQVQTAPLPDDWGTELISRAKRSLLWRWNTLRPVGASCRESSECGTKYCRARTCAFQVFAS